MLKRYRKYIIAFLLILAFCISICFVPINASKFIPVVEKQVAKDLGIQIHIEKLIFRFGPALKVKAPVMHIMYEDGQKFGQFNNVKFYLPWSALIKDDVYVKRIYADKIIVKLNSNDKYLPDLLEKFRSKDFKENPDITMRDYDITYNDKSLDKAYKIAGGDLELTKVPAYKNMKLNTVGNFYINDKQYISYTLSVLPNLTQDEFANKNFDVKEFVQQIENLDFHADVIADLKIYKNQNGELQYSGTANIDNISVLDKEKKNPKSFIYLTLLGNKIKLLSNIYATGDKKVYAEGFINNSKKTEVDIRVKTDEINLNDMFNKIKLLVDCSKFKGIDKIDGILTADFSIKGDLSKIKSSGFLKIANASIKAGKLNVNKIASDIDFSNNIITISNAIGYVNNAPIMMKGKVDKNIDLELLLNKVELKHMCPESFGIQSGVISMVANITGTSDNIIHKENIQIEKLKAEKNKNVLAFDSLKIDTEKDSTAYISNITIKPEQTEIIKLPLLKLNIDRERIKIPETNVFMPNSKLKAKAEITDYNNNNMAFNFNLFGFVYSRDINCLKNTIANYPIKLNVTGNKNTQNIDGQVVLTNAYVFEEPVIINLNSKVDNGTLKIDDLSVTNFSGELTNDTKTSPKGNKKVVITGNVENLKSPILKNIRVFIPQQLGLTIFDTVVQTKGDIFINGKISEPEVVGQLSIPVLVNPSMQMSASDITLDFNKNISVLNTPMMKLGDSSLGINAIISNDISKEILIKNANIKSKYINTDTILMYKDASIMKMYPIRINEGKIYAERADMTVYSSPLYITALTGDFKLKDNILSFKNLAGEMYNGKLSANMDFNLKDESFNSNIQARGVSAAPIFDVIAIKKDTVSGSMNFDTKLTGNIASKQSLNGTVLFEVHNGHMGTLGKLEHLLYAQNVIADSMLRTSLSVVTKAITLKDTGLFKILRGDIVMKDGVANINMLQSQGPLMALYIKGQYYPATDYAKLNILGRLSDEVVSGLGAFGEFSLNKLMIMLTGEENKYNISPVDIDKLPQLPSKNTKEFASTINGILEKPSSVIRFNWISYTKKSLKQKEVPMDNTKVPDFIEALPY